ncbi:MAG: hypothetical protein OHK0046_03370 [Anaerolineae bacterium]
MTQEYDYTNHNDEQDDEQDSSPATTIRSTAVPFSEANSAPTWPRQEPVRVPEPMLKEPPFEEARPLTVNGARPLYPPPPPSLLRESAARQRNRRRKGRARGLEWAWVVVAAVLLGIVAMLGLLIVMVTSSPDDTQVFLPTSEVDLAALPTAVSLRTDQNEVASGQPVTLSNGFSMILEPWDGQSRLTILLMGIDRRAGETGLAYRSDTMILVSIDPVTDRIGMLSIPRDLYIVVPGYSTRWRANSALVLGETNQPGSGPNLAMRAIQSNLGIRVHEYIVVDFRAVIGIVDAIGGINITSDITINDPLYPDMNFGYDPFYLPAGTYPNMDGTTALKYARTRHNDSDIERAGRQQQVVYAIRDKVLELNMIPQLILQAPSLLSSFEQNIQTSLDLPEMIQLAWYLKDIPAENITSGVLDYQYLTNFTTDNNEQVLIPGANLAQLMLNIFGPTYNQ